MKPHNLFISAVSAAFISAPVAAHEATIDDLTIIHPMAFETSKSAKAGAGYMMISNDGDTDDRLLEVRADFPRVMLHNTEEKDGIARMIHVESLDLPAGEIVALEPGGHHVMFMGLNGDPFEAGEEIPATLVFEKAGELNVTFKIEKRNDTGGSEEGTDHSDHTTN